MGKEFSSMIKGKRFRKKKILSHSLWLPSSLWVRCVRTHIIMKHVGHLGSWGRGQEPHRLTEPVSCYQWAVGLCWLIAFHSWFFLITFLSSSFSELPPPFPLFFSSYPLHIFNDFEGGMVWNKNSEHTGTQEKLQVLNCPLQVSSETKWGINKQRSFTAMFILSALPYLLLPAARGAFVYRPFFYMMASTGFIGPIG